MQNMIDFCHNKDIDILRLGCALPNLANICLHKSTDANFYLLTDADKERLCKLREDVVGGPPIIFTRKAVVDETFFRKSINICKSIVGIDASQLYPCSMCQLILADLYSLWDFDQETSRFIPRQNKTRTFEKIFTSLLQRTIPDCKMESIYTKGRRKKNSLLQCWRIFFSLQHSVWSHELLLSLSSLSGETSITY